MNHITPVFAFRQLLLGAVIGASLGCHLFAPLAVFSLVGTSAVADTAAAGTIAGAIFRWYQLFALAALLVLIALVSPRTRRETSTHRDSRVVALLIAALLFLLSEIVYITPEIARMRGALADAYGSVSLAPPGDPLRARFGFFHGLSMIRALVELLLMIAAFLVPGTRARGES